MKSGKNFARLVMAGAASALAFAVSTPTIAQDRPAWGNHPQQKGVEIVTLGTAGGPPPHSGRAQPSTLLMVDGKKYLIDAGEAAGYQLLQAGIPPKALDAIFITHLHWDHVLGLDYLMATEWMRGRTVKLPVYGPPGLDFFMSRELAALEIGENIFRAQADPRPYVSSLYPSHEITDCAPSTAYKDEFVKVTSICNSHFAEVHAPDHSYGDDRALSYRFDTKYGAVTFTGDTGPSEALVELAKGSDVLVSEIVDLPSIEQALKWANPDGDNSLLMQHMAHQHLTPEEVGKLATAAGVKTVVLTHYVIGPQFDPANFVAQVREYFDGEVIASKDLGRVKLPEN